MKINTLFLLGFLTLSLQAGTDALDPVQKKYAASLSYAKKQYQVAVKKIKLNMIADYKRYMDTAIRQKNLEQALDYKNKIKKLEAEITSGTLLPAQTPVPTQPYTQVTPTNKKLSRKERKRLKKIDPIPAPPSDKGLNFDPNSTGIDKKNIREYLDLSKWCVKKRITDSLWKTHSTSKMRITKGTSSITVKNTVPDSGRCAIFALKRTPQHFKAEFDYSGDLRAIRFQDDKARCKYIKTPASGKHHVIIIKDGKSVTGTINGIPFKMKPHNGEPDMRKVFLGFCLTPNATFTLSNFTLKEL